MHCAHKGFTLIELMIVIAIIGILAMIAIPAYQAYTIKAQISEGISLSDGLKTAFDDNFAETGVVAASNPAMDITRTISGSYVTSVTLTAPGQITVRYSGNANYHIANGTIVWTAYKAADGDISWLCNDGTSASGAMAGPPQLTPLGATAINGNISSATGEAEYLPQICR